MGGVKEAKTEKKKEDWNKTEHFVLKSSINSGRGVLLVHTCFLELTLGFVTNKTNYKRYRGNFGKASHGPC